MAAAENYVPFAMPFSWECVDAKMSVIEKETIAVDAEKHLGGIQCSLRFPQGRRIQLQAEIKGKGKVTVAMNGSFGWAYKNVELSEEWQSVKTEYGEPSGSLKLAVLSLNNGAADIQLRNLRTALMDISVFQAEEIPAVGFKALHYPGPNGKIAADGMQGGCWYHLVRIPVPANTLPIYYYVHLKSDGGVIQDLYWMAGGQRTDAPNTLSAEGANGKWAWIKTGPYQAGMLSEYVTLGFSGSKTINATVDKIVLSTNGDLADQKLDDVELQ